MSQDFTESFFFISQNILKADMEDMQFPRVSTLLQYVDGLLLCSFPQASS